MQSFDIKRKLPEMIVRKTERMQNVLLPQNPDFSFKLWPEIKQWSKKGNKKKETE